jgi:hypothetical protein
VLVITSNVPLTQGGVRTAVTDSTDQEVGSQEVRGSNERDVHSGGRGTDRDETGDASTVYEVLASTPRRRLLSRLARADDEWVPLTDLADAVAEDRVRTAADPETAREDARIELRHVHLPKLAAAGLAVVDRTDDPSGGVVRLSSDGRTVLGRIADGEV